MTMFVDMTAQSLGMDGRRVIQVEEGKGANTIEKFVRAFREHNGDTEAVKNVCCDMSPAFIAGVEKHMPEAAITFDRYHVMKVLSASVDKVRRQEVMKQEILKKTRYLWLTNRPNLSDKQSARLKGILSMTKLKLKTVRSYHIRENFQLFYEIAGPQVAETYLRSWFWRATHSRIEEMREAAWTIRRHWRHRALEWEGVLNWHSSKISNGLLEGLNSLFQAAKAKARGYRSARKRRTIIYLLLGKLQFNLPNPLPT